MFVYAGVRVRPWFRRDGLVQKIRRLSIAMISMKRTEL